MTNDVQLSGAAETVATPSGGAAIPQSPTGVNVDVSAQADVEKIDLTQHPQFRNWQSAMDKRLAEERKARLELQSRLQELEAQRQQQDLASLSDLDAEERAARLEAMLKAQQEREKQMQIVAQAAAMCERAGVDINDPRLADAKALGANERGLAAIAQRIVEIVADDREKAKLTAQTAVQAVQAQQATQTQVAAQRAEQQALAEAGVLKTAGGPTSVVTPDPNQQRMQKLTGYRQRYAQMIGAGFDDPRYRRLIDDMRTDGFTLGDLIS